MHKGGVVAEVTNPEPITDLSLLSSENYYVLQNVGSSLYNYYNESNTQMSAKNSYDYSCVVRLDYNSSTQTVTVKQDCTDTYYQGLTADTRLALGEDAVNFTLSVVDATNGYFRFANGSCYLNRNSSSEQFPMGAAQSFTGDYSKWKIYKVTVNKLIEDGKVYNLKFVTIGETKSWGLTSTGTSVSIGENATGSPFVAHAYKNFNGQRRFIFVNNEDGYYLAFKNAIQTYTLNNTNIEFTVGLLSESSSSGISSDVTAEQKAGYIYIASDTREAGSGDVGCYVITTGGGWSQARDPFFNDAHTSAISTQKTDAEISSTAALAIAKFDALYKAKPYKAGAIGVYRAEINGTTYRNIHAYEKAINSATEVTALANTSFEYEPVENGKVYKIYSYQYDGSLYQIVNENNAAVIKPSGDVDDKNGCWVLHKTTVTSGDDKYVIESAAGDGNYLGWKENDVNPYYFNFLINSAVPGSLILYSANGGTGGGRNLYVHKNTSNGPKNNGWDQSSAYFAESGSTYYCLESVNTFEPSVLSDTENVESSTEKHDFITLNRNIVEGFNTVVFPFDLTAAQVKTLFGEGAVVYTYSEDSEDKNNITIELTAGDGSIPANTPVLVNATRSTASNTLVGVTMKYNENPVVLGKYIDFTGVYTTNQTIPEGDYFVNEALYKSNGNVSIKPFRAYFHVREEVSNVKLKIGGTMVTGIDGINRSDVVKDDVIYNLLGQRVNKMQKGIYIVNGKKVVIK